MSLASAKSENLWAIVPVKNFSEAKSRLAGALNPVERYKLARALLENLLQLLQTIRSEGLLSGFAIISTDAAAGELATSYGGLFLTEVPVSKGESYSNLNHALEYAGRWMTEHVGAKSLAIIPSDLPLVTLPDLRELLRPLPTPGARLVPDTRHNGTNALIINPASLLDFSFSFGDNSFEIHREALVKAGVPFPEIMENPHLNFDLDVEEDLEKLPINWAIARLK